MNKDEYKKLVSERTPPSPIFRDCLMAFLFGGAICTLGQLILNIWMTLGLSREDAATAETLTLVFLGAMATGLGFYDRLAKHAGAGTLVPITGFSNAVAAPALEFKTEGFILGVGAKMFTIAGPVIVYGMSASVVYGFVYWIYSFM